MNRMPSARRAIPVFCLLLAGCGGKASEPMTDLGVPPPVDAAVMDAAPVDFGPPLTGTMRLAEDGLSLQGSTLDDWVFVSDPVNGLRAVPAGGQAPVALSTLAANNYAQRGVEVIFESPPSGAGHMLSVWTPSAGLHRLSSGNASDYPASPVVSTDGQWVAWLDKLASDGTTGDFTVARADGTGVHVVYPGLRIGVNGCYTTLAECGGSRFCVTRCAAGDQHATYSVVDAAAGTAVDVKTGVTSGVDHTDAVAIVFAADGVWFFPSDGRPAVQPVGIDANTTWWVGGDSVFYRSMLGGVERIDLQSGATPIDLQSGATFVLALNPDGVNLVYCTPTQLFGAPLQPGDNVLLDDNFTGLGSTDWTYRGWAFSSDGQSWLYMNNKSELRRAPLDGSGALVLLQKASGFLPLPDGRVLAERLAGPMMYDVLWIDPASGAASQPLLSSVAQTAVANRRLAWLVPSGSTVQLWDATF
jgi:hypothetical protein